MGDSRTIQIDKLEFEAEILVAHQLDLIAQLERQLRAVHQTMRQIEQLRATNRKAGRELANGAKTLALETLAGELSAIDRELNIQHESCLQMQQTVETMVGRLRALQGTAVLATQPAKPQSPEQPPG